MSFENFDNKIKQAADQHHPNYDERAWNKMAKLLDKHLPQKDDRRRGIIFFLLLFLLMGGGAWLVISKPWQQSSQTLSEVNTPQNSNDIKPSADSPGKIAEKPTKENLPGDRQSDKQEVSTPVIDNSDGAGEKKNIAGDKANSDSKPKNNQDFVVTAEKTKASSYKQDKKLTAKKDRTDQVTIDVADAAKNKKDKTTSPDNPVAISPVKIDDKTMKNDNVKTLTDKTAKNDVPKDIIAETKKEEVAEQPKTSDDKKEIAKKSGVKKKNSFFFSLSAGPDISSVGLDNPGKVRLLAGAGFGYTFNNRWTIRTGFYSARKIYSATKEDYKPPVQLPNFPYLDRIDANCKVYEIPVSLAYNFSRSNKHNLFASAGLSSFIMKKETYHYLYKWPGSPVIYTYDKTIDNEYKHYFSVLTLSGGYQRRINKTFSITAEPYIKVPLAGVGYGKVKLNSAGILFSAVISPFQPGVKK